MNLSLLLSTDVSCSRIVKSHRIMRRYSTEESKVMKTYQDVPPVKGINFPLVGHISALQKVMSNPVGNVIEMYGNPPADILRCNIVGTEMLRIWRPEHIKIVLEHEGAYPYGSVNQLWPMAHLVKHMKLKAMLPLSTGEEWGTLRKKLQKGIFAPQDAAQAIPFIEESIKNTMEKIGEEDLSDLLLRNSFDMFTAFVFGKSFDAINHRTEETDFIVKAVVEFLGESLALFPQVLPRFMITKQKRRFYDNFEKLFDILHRRIQEKMDYMVTAPEDDPIFKTYFGHYLSTHGEEDVQTEFVSNLISFFSASVDTTSVTLQWIMYHLAKNPEKQEKLYEEFMSVVGDTYLTPADFGKLSYAKACFRESTRITPSVTLISRILPVDVEIAGYNIPSGTSIFMDANLIAARDPSIFEEPMVYKPERWLREEKKKRKESGLSFPHDSIC
eukprot:TRINITY_DN6919_c0_g1_i1.p1 TRINITY_DN6919_c0_g1~~TRINITY_DN6919_c0_g1_i1.p1  ORF type:complete len:443 (+),score=108.85 TRINITY_DN6919_c0_g1_i1:18-1346(+)